MWWWSATSRFWSSGCWIADCYSVLLRRGFQIIWGGGKIHLRSSFGLRRMWNRWKLGSWTWLIVPMMPSNLNLFFPVNAILRLETKADSSASFKGCKAMTRTVLWCLNYSMMEFLSFETHLESFLDSVSSRSSVSTLFAFNFLCFISIFPLVAIVCLDFALVVWELVVCAFTAVLAILLNSTGLPVEVWAT